MKLPAVFNKLVEELLPFVAIRATRINHFSIALKLGIYIYVFIHKTDITKNWNEETVEIKSVWSVYFRDPISRNFFIITFLLELKYFLLRVIQYNIYKISSIILVTDIFNQHKAVSFLQTSYWW